MKIERKVEFTWVDGKGIIDWKKKIWTNIIEKKREIHVKQVNIQTSTFHEDFSKAWDSWFYVNK